MTFETEIAGYVLAYALIAGVCLAACGGEGLDLILGEEAEACELDEDCPTPAICHGTDYIERACWLPCLFNEDCPEGQNCGPLVGETHNVRVCFVPDA